MGWTELHVTHLKRQTRVEKPGLSFSRESGGGVGTT
jgi:hypothetical protein